MSFLKIGLMALFFGSGATLTLHPQTLGPGVTNLRAQKSIEPVSDSVQVFISLGVPSEDQKTAVSYGKFGLVDVGNMRVELCSGQERCEPMKYVGAYLAPSDYGVTFALTDPAAKGVKFTGVRIDTHKAVHSATVRWQNYLK